MKTSVLASMLFGTLAVAAPFQRRARLTKTEVVTTTVFSTVTVYDDEPAPTSSQALFYEQPKPSSAAPVYTSAAAPAVPANTPVYTPAASPSPVVQASKPAPPAPAVTSAAPPPPAPPVIVTPPTSAAPAPLAQPTSSTYTPSTGGAQHTGVDMTMYNGYGVKGACSTVLIDTNIFVALSKGVFGDATFDRMTGEANNPWCQATVKVEYEGKTVTAPVVDRCAGCPGDYDIDLSPAAWAALGLGEGNRLKASWSRVS